MPLAETIRMDLLRTHRHPQGVWNLSQIQSCPGRIGHYEPRQMDGGPRNGCFQRWRHFHITRVFQVLVVRADSHWFVDSQCRCFGASGTKCRRRCLAVGLPIHGQNFHGPNAIHLWTQHVGSSSCDTSLVAQFKKRQRPLLRAVLLQRWLSFVLRLDPFPVFLREDSTGIVLPKRRSIWLASIWRPVESHAMSLSDGFILERSTLAFWMLVRRPIEMSMVPSKGVLMAADAVTLETTGSFEDANYGEGMKPIPW